MSTVEYVDVERDSPAPRRVPRLLLSNPLALASLAALAVIAILAIVYPVVSPYSYSSPTNTLSSGPSLAHWLGTDSLGYDVMTRITMGARVSLSIGLIVELFVLLVGVSVGLIAGYFGGWVDTALMRVTDLTFALPDILLAILIMAVLGPSLLNLFLALAITGWPSMARLVRGQAQSLRSRDFIDASRAVGLRNSTIIMRHVLPNLLSPIIVASTIDIAGIIIAESTLSFLGIGVKPPMPSWGSMISGPLSSLEYLSHPMLVIFPALFLSVTVLSLNFLGDALRDALDPRHA